MEKRISKKKLNQTPKTYVVYQDRYGNYEVYDPSDNYRPNEFVKSFEAEVGAEWFCGEHITISLDKDDIEEAGYTLEDLDNMSSTELYKAVCKIHPDICSVFEGASGPVEECTDNIDEAYGLEDNGDDYVVVTLINKVKCKMGEGIVEIVE